MKSRVGNYLIMVFIGSDVSMTTTIIWPNFHRRVWIFTTIYIGLGLLERINDVISQTVASKLLGINESTRDGFATTLIDGKFVNPFSDYIKPNIWEIIGQYVKSCLFSWLEPTFSNTTKQRWNYQIIKQLVIIKRISLLF